MLRTRITLLSAACVWLWGCAMHAPIGARGVANELDYRPFTPAAAQRQVPAEVASGSGQTGTAAAPAPFSPKPGARDEAVQLARKLVGKKAVVLAGKRYPDDCSGLVKAVYAQVGLDVLANAQTGDNAVTAIWRFAASNGRIYQGGRPVAGDLVFFKETYDLNRDGRVNDGLTHVGVVDDIDEDGTVYVIHRVARGVVRYRMNLGYPDAATLADGRLVNDWLRTAGNHGKAQLTSQLFAGFATVLPVEPKFSASR